MVQCDANVRNETLAKFTEPTSAWLADTDDSISTTPASGSEVMIVIDTAGKVETQIELLKSKDVRAVARYYSTRLDRCLTRSEAAALTAAGLEIVAIFEDGGDPDLSTEQGIHDAQVARLHARNVGQPSGSAIYFALKRAPDGSPGVDLDAIGSYFTGVRNVLSDRYKVGVFSDALVCEALLRRGACDYAWLIKPASRTDSGGVDRGAHWAMAERDIAQDWEGLSVNVSEAAEEIGTFTALTETAAAIGAPAAAAGLQSAMITPDGYVPPPASRGQLDGVPFDQAIRVGEKFSDRFHDWDQTPKGRIDPSRCKGLYRLPGGVLFWESKMAIDADGSPTPSVLASSSGSSPHTSLMFSHTAGATNAINAEVVPYFVLPKGDFVDEFGIELGTLGIVIFEDRITGAIFADQGPRDKIGEASIRVHEIVRGAAAPWKGNPADKILRDVSVEKGVLFCVFPNARFDIDAFGPNRQQEMASAIHTAAMVEFNRLKSAPRLAAHLMLAQAAEAAPARTPFDFFALAGSWQALLNELNGNRDGAVDDDAAQLPFALEAIPKLLQRSAGSLLIGFDADVIENGAFASAVELAISVGATLAVRVDGPGTPTGRTWRQDDRRRLRARAATVLSGFDVEEVNFKQLLDLWDNGAWWTFTRRQLSDFRKRGIVACAIDNIERVLERFPASFGNAGPASATTAVLGFLKEYANAHATGELPDLIIRNLDVGALELIKAAVEDGSLPRSIFADFHIAEEDSTEDRARQEQLTADIGIQTLRVADAGHFYVMGSFGDAARSRFTAAMRGSTVAAKTAIAAPAPSAEGIAPPGGAAGRQRIGALSPRASISLQLMSRAAGEARRGVNPGFVTTMARGALPASLPAMQLVPVLVETDHDVTDLLQAADARDVEQLTPSVASVLVPVAKAGMLVRDDRIRFIESVKEKRPLLDRALLDAMVLGVAQSRTVKEIGNGTTIGIVDTGFDLSHPAFRSNGSLRVDALWDQTTNERIVGVQNLQVRWQPGGDRPGADVNGHGTHVASIAGGSPFSGLGGVAPGARFILVKTDFQRIANGVKWCFDNSNGRPCVVNLSLGGHYGAHDGQGVEERVLAQLSGPGRIVVAAAGNEREDNIHIGARFGPSQTETVIFDVAQNAQPQAVMTLWYDVRDDFDIALISPGGIEMPVPSVGMSDSRETDGAVIEIARNVSNHSTSVQTQIVLNFNELVAFDGSLSNWMLRMTCRRAVVGRLDGWMAGERLAAFRSGRMLEATRTIGMPATANNVIAVASHVSKNTWISDRGTEIAPRAVAGRSSRFSSQGPTRDGREKPEISAPGEMITAALAVGSKLAGWPERDNAAMRTLTIEGTSMATPMVTGALAVLLEHSPTLTPADALRALRDGATRDIFTAGLRWTPEYGFGKLSLGRAMDAIKT
jgi:subtilisin family serine protease